MVDGDVVLSIADCAEEFDVVNDEPVEPGDGDGVGCKWYFRTISGGV